MRMMVADSIMFTLGYWFIPIAGYLVYGHYGVLVALVIMITLAYDELRGQCGVIAFSIIVIELLILIGMMAKMPIGVMERPLDMLVIHMLFVTLLLVMLLLYERYHYNGLSKKLQKKANKGCDVSWLD